jgi:hypothetical protein
MYLLIYLTLFIIILSVYNIYQKEGYFTYYKGMPGIQKTYISTGNIRDPGSYCWQNERID